jgi:tetratricopeptide (TPR) repeat protein
MRQPISENRQDRQERRSENREDWQNWHDDHYHHGDWYHDGWHGYGDGSWWNHMWDDHTAAMVLGTTMWGLNRMGYWFGYSDYSNPYYDASYAASAPYDYSEPLAAPPMEPAVTEATGAAPAPTEATSPGLQSFDAARQAFFEGRYTEALTLTDQALAQMPRDAVIHEFRALVLFALGQYQQAAATLHAVLAVGPGWDWTTLAGLYPSVDVYTQQLRALEAYTKSHPNEAAPRFLLAYHYITGNHLDAAITQLQYVAQLQPDDEVAKQLLATFGASVPSEEPAPQPVQAAAPAVDESKLLGNWTASRPGGAEFSLTLTKDHQFTWVYTKGNKREEVKGVFALNGSVLALEPNAGGVMVAELSKPSDTAFTFREAGAPASDPGLSFRRGA